MGEYVDPDYRSEFEAPVYTILSRERVGDRVLTTVMMEGGEIIPFDVSSSVYDRGREIEKPIEQRFQDIIKPGLNNQ